MPASVSPETAHALTVLRAIRAGKISASKDQQGEGRIEPPELHRVYPAVQANEARPEQAHEGRIEPPELHRVYPAVQANEARPEQAHQDALIAELRNALADMRRDRDEWREQAQRLALLAPKAEPVQPKKLDDFLIDKSARKGGRKRRVKR